MNTLSNGQNSTLGIWRDLCAATFGEDSKATAFLDAKIESCKRGRKEEVPANEGQLLQVLGRLHFGEPE